MYGTCARACTKREHIEKTAVRSVSPKPLHSYVYTRGFKDKLLAWGVEYVLQYIVKGSKVLCRPDCTGESG